jgi:Ser/Thr protein kinase RdoA (MazF antagonist)
MGVRRTLSLAEANGLFGGCRFDRLEPTSDGIIDTTYIAASGGERSILKHYERATAEQVAAEEALLHHLRHCGLNVPEVFGEGKAGWRRFGCLEGESPKRVTLKQVGRVGAFLGTMHRATRGIQDAPAAFDRKEIADALRRIRRHSPVAFLHFRSLAENSLFANCDGIIHGDLFPDNCVFDGSRIGVFDFIESGCGSFLLDAGIVAANWALRGSEKGRARRFLSGYNRYAPTKITFRTLCIGMEAAVRLYGMKRYIHTKLEKGEARPYGEQLLKLRQIQRLSKGTR